MVVGGGRNSESVIRRRRFKKGTYEVVLVTPSIVSDQEFRSFWIKFIGDTVLFGRGSDVSMAIYSFLFVRARIVIMHSGSCHSA